MGLFWRNFLNFHISLSDFLERKKEIFSSIRILKFRDAAAYCSRFAKHEECAESLLFFAARTRLISTVFSSNELKKVKFVRYEYYYRYMVLTSIWHFWPRALLKGPKRSFIVVVGMDTWAKSVTNGTKNVRNGLIRPSTASSDLLWYCMAFYGLEWFLWHIVVLFGLLYGLLWPFMAKYRIDLTSIVFSRGHRSKFIWSCLW